MQSNFVEILEDFYEQKNSDDFFFGEDTFDFKGLIDSDPSIREGINDDLFEEPRLHALG
jgi:hypothetical protein